MRRKRQRAGCQGSSIVEGQEEGKQRRDQRSRAVTSARKRLTLRIRKWSKLSNGSGVQQDVKLEAVGHVNQRSLIDLFRTVSL